MTTSSTIRLTTSGMRRLLLLASFLVLTIGTPLFLLPAETNALFSWTINPPLTAAFLGGGYWASFIFEYFSSREHIWARSRIAVPAVFVFTALTLIVTLIHIDKFHFGSDVSVFTKGVTWVWLVIYAAVPVIMAALWWKQVRSAGQEPARGSPMPGPMRRALIGQAAVMLPLGTALLFAPTSVGPSIWPWGLSALTGRAIGAWVIAMGIAAGQAAWEEDLLRLRGAMLALGTFGTLQLVAVVRFAGADHPVTGDPVLDWGDLRTWVYVGFVFSLGAVGLWGWLAARNAVRAESIPAS